MNNQIAKLLNEHWELSIQLDKGSTNTCIQQIFMACEDLIDGKFISGAGGGGYLACVVTDASSFCAAHPGAIELRIRRSGM